MRRSSGGCGSGRETRDLAGELFIVMSRPLSGSTGKGNGIILVAVPLQPMLSDPGGRKPYARLLVLQ